MIGFGRTGPMPSRAIPHWDYSELTCIESMLIQKNRGPNQLFVSDTTPQEVMYDVETC